MQEFALLLGIVIAEWILLYPRMTDSSGYFWPALRRTGIFILFAAAARRVVRLMLLKLDSSDYFWPALKRTGVFILFAIAARWVVGLMLLKLLLVTFDSDLLRSWMWGFVTGLIVSVYHPGSLSRDEGT
jgi:ABC-type sugar transport system permease subunit